MQRIVPHLWFDNQVLEATQFYTSIFPESSLKSVTKLNHTPSGDTYVVRFYLFGYEFIAINGGPYFKFNLSMSFIVLFYEEKDEKQKLHELWHKLLDGGKVIMPLQAYPFSPYFGWIEDKYGLSWQLYLGPKTYPFNGRIMPAYLFTDQHYKNAKPAMDFYRKVFKGINDPYMYMYKDSTPGESPNAVQYSDFMLENQPFSFTDTKSYPEDTFNESVSLLIRCQTQEEVDYYWDKLTYYKESEQCGWLKDRFGLSWQVHPTLLDDMLKDGTVSQIENVTKAFLQMKKFDIEALKEAFNK